MKLVEKLSFENFPIYMGTTDNEISNDLFYEQKWVECSKCGCLQLLNLLPLEIIYQANHHTEVVGKTWLDHHDAFSVFVSKSSPKKILEIGAAHGYLATKIIEDFPNIEYTIVEPDSNLVDSRIKIVKGFIEDHFIELKNKDCIIHSHVLEHVYNPVEFINSISKNVNVGTNMFISFPNMNGLIKSGGLNSLNFEHTYLLDPKHAELFLVNSGFLILNKERYMEHSYFYQVVKENDINPFPLEYPNIESEAQEFQEMVSALKKFIVKSNQIIKTQPGPIYLFGAHIFSQSLIFLGIEIDRIYGILDNSFEKQNKRLYGTELKVYDPSVISTDTKPVVILNASHYQNEIRQQLLSLNPNVLIIENSKI
jgi:2-polyprenyl-3-methyl-5-hydroxy-6-metoxy-1,4-benzoquinol methylase